MDDRIDEGWVTNEEMAAWLKLVESHIPNVENSKATALPKPSDPPGPPSTTLAIVSASACHSSSIGHPGSRRVRARGFHSFLLCATVSLVAFSFVIWIAGRGVQPKLGPGGDDQGVAHPGSVRLILPGTLDGQSIPGRGSGLPERRRDLSPVYPTYPASPGSHEDQSIPQATAETSPSPRSQDEGNDVSPAKASTLARATGEAEAWDGEAVRDSPIHADAPAAGVPRFLHHLAPGSRYARGSYAHRQAYLAWRRVRSAYSVGSFARLSASDHGR
jgi:hypothetical protein